MELTLGQFAIQQLSLQSGIESEVGMGLIIHNWGEVILFFFLLTVVLLILFCFSVNGGIFVGMFLDRRYFIVRCLTVACLFSMLSTGRFKLHRLLYFIFTASANSRMSEWDKSKPYITTTSFPLTKFLRICYNQLWYVFATPLLREFRIPERIDKEQVLEKYRFLAENK